MESHDLTDWANVTAPTCTEIGTDERHCTNIGCSYSETRAVAKLGHDMGNWFSTLDPTCTDIGTDKRICIRTDCEHFETRITEKLDHEFSDEYTVDRAPTCSEVGIESHHCTRCDKTSGARNIEKLPHTYNDGEVTLKPTAAIAGIKTFTCTECGHTYTEAIDKLTPAIIEQNATVWKEWSDNETITFRSNASYDDFVEVRINGELLSNDLYTLREGSIVVELNPEYLASLENGEYSLEIVSLGGVAKTNFSVDKKIVQNPVVLGSGITVVAIALLAFAVWLVFVKKKWLMTQTGAKKHLNDSNNKVK